MARGAYGRAGLRDVRASRDGHGTGTLIEKVAALWSESGRHLAKAIRDADGYANVGISEVRVDLSLYELETGLSSRI